MIRCSRHYVSSDNGKNNVEQIPCAIGQKMPPTNCSNTTIITACARISTGAVRTIGNVEQSISAKCCNRTCQDIFESIVATINANQMTINEHQLWDIRQSILKFQLHPIDIQQVTTNTNRYFHQDTIFLTPISKHNDFQENKSSQ